MPNVEWVSASVYDVDTEFVTLERQCWLKGVCEGNVTNGTDGNTSADAVL